MAMNLIQSSSDSDLDFDEEEDEDPRTDNISNELGDEDDVDENFENLLLDELWLWNQDDNNDLDAEVSPNLQQPGANWAQVSPNLVPATQMSPSRSLPMQRRFANVPEHEVATFWSNTAAVVDAVDDRSLSAPLVRARLASRASRHSADDTELWGETGTAWAQVSPNLQSFANEASVSSPSRSVPMQRRPANVAGHEDMPNSDDDTGEDRSISAPPVRPRRASRLSRNSTDQEDLWAEVGSPPTSTYVSSNLRRGLSTNVTGVVPSRPPPPPAQSTPLRPASRRVPPRPNSTTSPTLPSRRSSAPTRLSSPAQTEAKVVQNQMRPVGPLQSAPSACKGLESLLSMPQLPPNGDSSNGGSGGGGGSSAGAGSADCDAGSGGTGGNNDGGGGSGGDSSGRKLRADRFSTEDDRSWAYGMGPCMPLGKLVRHVLRNTDCAHRCLGLPSDAYAPNGVRKRYLVLARRLHPDKCEHALAGQAFAAVRRAAQLMLAHTRDPRAKRL